MKTALILIAIGRFLYGLKKGYSFKEASLYSIGILGGNRLLTILYFAIVGAIILVLFYGISQGKI